MVPPLRLTLAAGTLAVAATLFTDVLAAQQPAGLPDYFYSEGRLVSVRVFPESLGILVRAGFPRDSAVAPLQRLGLRVVRPASEEVLIALPPRDSVLTDKLRATRYAVELRRRADGLVTQAGFVIWAEGAQGPLIVTDQVIVQFRVNVTAAQMDSTVRALSGTVIQRNPLRRGQLLLAVDPRRPTDALELGNRYQEHPLVEYAHPNFVHIIEQRGFQAVIPNDPLFGNQWHLNNTGQSAGTVDADIDAPEAWDLTMGVAGIRIGVLDNGFDVAHPDLIGNRFTNAGETPGNGLDDDGNGFVDDVNGWDFTACDAPTPPAGCGSGVIGVGNHGTAVAGSAAAVANNNLGVAGSCPGCTWVPLRRGTTNFASGLAFNYAQAFGFQIITNSWGFPIGTPATTNLVTAINGAAGAGAVILFAMNNPNVNDCVGGTPDISSLANVIAVARSSNRDQFDFSGFGNCMELMGPSAGLQTVPSGRGTLWGTTTDVQGAAGYNNAAASASCPSADPAPPPATNRDYTNCFNGTSFATPVLAGVVGLALSADATLTRVQVQRLLQDTADRVEDSQGAYAQVNGFSAPAAGNATHGWGRANAFEAVRVVAPVAAGGRARVDVFFRDNRLDWGNTEQRSNVLFEPVRSTIGHWRSQDIKVDAPPYATAPTAATFDAFADETPSAIAGDVNRVYVRLRNRGPTTATSVSVKLHWTQFGTALPALPNDFWTAFPGNTADPASRWNPLNCSAGGTSCTISNLAYSGASVAGTGADAAQIVSFDFPAPAIDPLLANHFCLFAVADAGQDRAGPLTRPTTANDFQADWLTPRDNNITHRNYQNLVDRSDRDASAGFLVRNPNRFDIPVMLKAVLPSGWYARLDTLGFDQPFRLAAGAELRNRVTILAPDRLASGEVTIEQWRVDSLPELMGGLTLFSPGAGRPDSSAGGAPAEFLVGDFVYRPRRIGTVVRVINPGPQHMVALVALFTAAGQPRACRSVRIPANGEVTVDLATLLKEPGAGVVKVFALDPPGQPPRGYLRRNEGTHPIEVPLLRTSVGTEEELRRVRAGCP